MPPPRQTLAPPPLKTPLPLPTKHTHTHNKRYGRNALTPPRKPGFLAKLWGQLNNVLIWVLLAACAVTAGLQEWIETCLILAVVSINVAIGLLQEGRAEKAADAIKDMLAPTGVLCVGGVRLRGLGGFGKGLERVWEGLGDRVRLRGGFVDGRLRVCACVWAGCRSRLVAAKRARAPPSTHTTQHAQHTAKHTRALTSSSVSPFATNSLRLGMSTPYTFGCLTGGDALARKTLAAPARRTC